MSVRGEFGRCLGDCLEFLEGAAGEDEETAVETGPVDVNRADLTGLQRLPGIGPATAAAIVAHRDEFGPFTTVDDLLAVPGIGPAKLAALRDAAVVS